MSKRIKRLFAKEKGIGALLAANAIALLALLLAATLTLHALGLLGSVLTFLF